MRRTASALLLAIALFGCTPETPKAPMTFEPDYTQFAATKAQSATTSASNAKTIGDWQDVASEWESAIASLEKVPSSSPSYATAQQKLQEYKTGLANAQKAIAQLKAKEDAVNAKVKQISGVEPKAIEWKQGVAIAVPEAAWTKLTQAEKTTLIDGIKTPTGWAVIVGRVQGQSVMLDREVCNPDLLKGGKCF